MCASINNKNFNYKHAKSFITQNHLLILRKKKHREKIHNTGKTQGKHREFYLCSNVNTLQNFYNARDWISSTETESHQYWKSNVTSFWKLKCHRVSWIFNLFWAHQHSCSTHYTSRNSFTMNKTESLLHQWSHISTEN